MTSSTPCPPWPWSNATGPMLACRWLINPEWAPLLDGNPHVDEVIDFPRRAFRGLGSAAAAARWAIRLRRALRGSRAGFPRPAAQRADLPALPRARGPHRRALRCSRRRPLFLRHRGRCLAASPRRRSLSRARGQPRHHHFDPTRVAPARRTAAPAGYRSPSSSSIPSRGAAENHLSPADVRDFCHALAPHPVVLAGRGSISPSARKTSRTSSTTPPFRN